MARSKKDGRGGGGHHNFRSGFRIGETALENGKISGWGETWNPKTRKFLKRKVARERRRFSKKIACKEVEKHFNECE